MSYDQKLQNRLIQDWLLPLKHQCQWLCGSYEPVTLPERIIMRVEESLRCQNPSTTSPQPIPWSCPSLKPRVYLLRMPALRKMTLATVTWICQQQPSLFDLQLWLGEGKTVRQSHSDLTVSWLWDKATYFINWIYLYWKRAKHDDLLFPCHSSDQVFLSVDVEITSFMYFIIHNVSSAQVHFDFTCGKHAR